MSRIDKIKQGDLLVNRTTKKPYIVLEVKKYQRKVYGSGPSGSTRKKFLLLSHQGRQTWKVDTEVKVNYYPPGSPYYDDIR